MLSRHKDEMTPEELHKAIDLIMEERGSDSYPPSPADLLAKIKLVAVRATPPKPVKLRDGDPERMRAVGKWCSEQHELVYLTSERGLWCDKCRKLQAVEGDRWRLYPNEVAALKLEPFPAATPEEVQALIDKHRPKIKSI